MACDFVTFEHKWSSGHHQVIVAGGGWAKLPACLELITLCMASFMSDTCIAFYIIIYIYIYIIYIYTYVYIYTFLSLSHVPL